MSLRFPVDSSDHIQGPDNALIEFVEYGDYQCPYCAQAYAAIKELQKKLGDKMKFVFRNFPLVDAHPNAATAAMSAEVAGHFGKFWEMHDMLYENQQYLDDASLIKYASELGISEAAFEQEFSNTTHENKIEKDIESGLRSGVNGTPSIYINGQKYEGNPYSVDALMAYIKEKFNI